MSRDQIILMNLCGRGDKDIFSVAEDATWRDAVSRIAARFADLTTCTAAGSGSRFWKREIRIRLRREAILRGMPEAGADLIEIGMPFTDPMADGPIVQAAGKRALQAGVKVRQCAGHKGAGVSCVADSATPVILMGYISIRSCSYGPLAVLRRRSSKGRWMG